MHYTSIENIHKVIDPLFFDDLKKEFEEIKDTKVAKTKKQKLLSFQEKLAGLKFLDPACGSGNFLTESYISLRRLENKVLSELTGGQLTFGEVINPIRCSIGQFYGIEINDFAVTVAKTALWIAENQMMKETEDIIHMDLDFLPLKTNATIIEGNALRMDWSGLHEEEKHPLIQAKKTNLISPDEIDESKMFPISVKESAKYEVVNLVTEELHVGKEKPAAIKNHYDYIMGNPPFVGYSLQNKEQKADILSVYTDESGKTYKTAGKIDYVAGWYFRAAEFIQNTNTKVAFVSTNSITQGEQVAGIWKPLYERFGIHIDFAYRTFRWDSESNAKAQVHCVIIGFSTINHLKDKIIFDHGTTKIVSNINPFLVEASDVFILSRGTPLYDVPNMTTGNRPADGGHLIIEKEDYSDFIKREPDAVKYIKKFIGSTEYINNKERYCLWLVGISPKELRKMPEVMKRVELCKQDRLHSPDKGRQKLADTPTIFREIQNPEQYVIIPRVSSERRRYIPIGFLDDNYIPSDSVTIIPGATLYHFGILTSNVHMAWMRTVAGRLKSDYRYSKDIVYNNFPWPAPTEEQKTKIEKTAQMILTAREKYPDSSLADLYDDLTMPPELRKAHQENDRAVMAAYGFSVNDTTESSCVTELMKMYQKKVMEHAK